MARTSKKDATWGEYLSANQTNKSDNNKWECAEKCIKQCEPESKDVCAVLEKLLSRNCVKVTDNATQIGTPYKLRRSSRENKYKKDYAMHRTRNFTQNVRLDSDRSGNHSELKHDSKRVPVKMIDSSTQVEISLKDNKRTSSRKTPQKPTSSETNVSSPKSKVTAREIAGWLIEGKPDLRTRLRDRRKHKISDDSLDRYINNFAKTADDAGKRQKEYRIKKEDSTKVIFRRDQTKSSGFHSNEQSPRSDEKARNQESTVNRVTTTRITKLGSIEQDVDSTPFNPMQLSDEMKEYKHSKRNRHKSSKDNLTAEHPVSYSHTKTIKSREINKSRGGETQVFRVSERRTRIEAHNKNTLYDAAKSYKEIDISLDKILSESQPNNLSGSSGFSRSRNLKFVKPNVIDDNTYTLPENDSKQNFVVIPYCRRTGEGDSNAPTSKEDCLYRIKNTDESLDSPKETSKSFIEKSKVILEDALSQESRTNDSLPSGPLYRIIKVEPRSHRPKVLPEKSKPIDKAPERISRVTVAQQKIKATSYEIESKRVSDPKRFTDSRIASDPARDFQIKHRHGMVSPKRDYHSQILSEEGTATESRGKDSTSPAPPTPPAVSKRKYDSKPMYSSDANKISDSKREQTKRKSKNRSPKRREDEPVHRAQRESRNSGWVDASKARSTKSSKRNEVKEIHKTYSIRTLNTRRETELKHFLASQNVSHPKRVSKQSSQYRHNSELTSKKHRSQQPKPMSPKSENQQSPSSDRDRKKTRPRKYDDAWDLPTKKLDSADITNNHVHAIQKEKLGSMSGSMSESRQHERWDAYKLEPKAVSPKEKRDSSLRSRPTPAQRPESQQNSRWSSVRPESHSRSTKTKRDSTEISESNVTSPRSKYDSSPTSESHHNERWGALKSGSKNESPKNMRHSTRISESSIGSQQTGHKLHQTSESRQQEGWTPFKSEVDSRSSAKRDSSRIAEYSPEHSQNKYDHSHRSGSRQNKERTSLKSEAESRANRDSTRMAESSPEPPQTKYDHFQGSESRRGRSSTKSEAESKAKRDSKRISKSSPEPSQSKYDRSQRSESRKYEGRTSIKSEAGSRAQRNSPRMADSSPEHSQNKYDHSKGSELHQHEGRTSIKSEAGSRAKHDSARMADSRPEHSQNKYDHSKGSESHQQEGRTSIKSEAGSRPKHHSTKRSEPLAPVSQSKHVSPRLLESHHPELRSSDKTGSTGTGKRDSSDRSETPAGSPKYKLERPESRQHERRKVLKPESPKENRKMIHPELDPKSTAKSPRSSLKDRPKESPYDTHLNQKSSPRPKSHRKGSSDPTQESDLRNESQAMPEPQGDRVKSSRAHSPYQTSPREEAQLYRSESRQHENWEDFIAKPTAEHPKKVSEPKEDTRDTSRQRTAQADHLSHQMHRADSRRDSRIAKLSQKSSQTGSQLSPSSSYKSAADEDIQRDRSRSRQNDLASGPRSVSEPSHLEENTEDAAHNIERKSSSDLKRVSYVYNLPDLRQDSDPEKQYQTEIELQRSSKRESQLSDSRPGVSSPHLTKPAGGVQSRQAESQQRDGWEHISKEAREDLRDSSHKSNTAGTMNDSRRVSYEDHLPKSESDPYWENQSRPEQELISEKQESQLHPTSSRNQNELTNATQGNRPSVERTKQSIDMRSESPAFQDMSSVTDSRRTSYPKRVSYSDDIIHPSQELDTKWQPPREDMFQGSSSKRESQLSSTWARMESGEEAHRRFVTESVAQSSQRSSVLEETRKASYNTDSRRTSEPSCITYSAELLDPNQELDTQWLHLNENVPQRSTWSPQESMPQEEDSTRFVSGHISAEFPERSLTLEGMSSVNDSRGTLDPKRVSYSNEFIDPSQELDTKWPHPMENIPERSSTKRESELSSTWARQQPEEDPHGRFVLESVAKSPQRSSVQEETTRACYNTDSRRTSQPINVTYSAELLDPIQELDTQWLHLNQNVPQRSSWSSRENTHKEEQVSRHFVSEQVSREFPERTSASPALHEDSKTGFYSRDTSPPRIRQSYTYEYKEQGSSEEYRPERSTSNVQSPFQGKPEEMNQTYFVADSFVDIRRTPECSTQREDPTEMSHRQDSRRTSDSIRAQYSSGLHDRRNQSNAEWDYGTGHMSQGDSLKRLLNLPRTSTSYQQEAGDEIQTHFISDSVAEIMRKSASSALQGTDSRRTYGPTTDEVLNSKQDLNENLDYGRSHLSPQSSPYTQHKSGEQIQRHLIPLWSPLTELPTKTSLPPTFSEDAGFTSNKQWDHPTEHGPLRSSLKSELPSSPTSSQFQHRPGEVHLSNDFSEFPRINSGLSRLNDDISGTSNKSDYRRISKQKRISYTDEISKQESDSRREYHSSAKHESNLSKSMPSVSSPYRLGSSVILQRERHETLQNHFEAMPSVETPARSSVIVEDEQEGSSNFLHNTNQMPNLKRESEPKQECLSEYESQVRYELKVYESMPGIPFPHHHTESAENLQKNEIEERWKDSQSTKRGPSLSLSPPVTLTRDSSVPFVTQMKASIHTDESQKPFNQNHDEMSTSGSNKNTSISEPQLGAPTAESTPRNEATFSLQVNTASAPSLYIKGEKESFRGINDSLPSESSRRSTQMHDNELRKDSLGSSPYFNQVQHPSEEGNNYEILKQSPAATPFKFDEKDNLNTSYFSKWDSDHLLDNLQELSLDKGQTSRNQVETLPLDEQIEPSLMYTSFTDAKRYDPDYDPYRRGTKSEPLMFSLELNDFSLEKSSDSRFGKTRNNTDHSKDEAAVSEVTKEQNISHTGGTNFNIVTFDTNADLASKLNYDMKTDEILPASNELQKKSLNVKSDFTSPTETLSPIKMEQNASLQSNPSAISSASLSHDKVYLSETLGDQPKLQGVDSELQNFVLYLQNRLKDCERKVQEQIENSAKDKKEKLNNAQLSKDNQRSEHEDKFKPAEEQQSSPLDEIEELPLQLESTRRSESESEACNCCQCGEKKNAEQDAESTMSDNSDIPPFKGCECMKEDYYKIMRLAYNK